MLAALIAHISDPGSEAPANEQVRQTSIYLRADGDDPTDTQTQIYAQMHFSFPNHDSLHHPVPRTRMPDTIDITKLAPAPTGVDRDLERLLRARLQQRFAEHNQPLSDANALFGAYPRSMEVLRDIIDLEPRGNLKAHALSPASSTSHGSSTSDESAYESGSGSSTTSSQQQQQESDTAAFFATRSRVVRLYNLPALAESFLALVFLPHNANDDRPPPPVPATMWERKVDVLAGRARTSVWAVFRTHDEASAALRLPMHVAPALEEDLEPFDQLARVVLTSEPLPNLSSSPAPAASRGNSLAPPQPHHHHLRVSASLNDLHNPSMPALAYTLSTNPPNPKTSFRLGDWICSSSSCAAHNFGRNLSCIGCGCPRANPGASSGTNTSAQHQHQLHGQHQQHQQYSATHQHQPQHQYPNQQPNQHQQRALPSPRFAASGVGSVTYYSSAPPPAQNFGGQQVHAQAQAQQQHQQQQQQQRQNLSVIPQRPTIGSGYIQPSPQSSSPLPQFTLGHQHPIGHQQQHRPTHLSINAPSPTPSVSASPPKFSVAAAAAVAHPPSHATSQVQTQAHPRPPASSSGAGAHPLLTPSGRAFAVGGRVQNISRDPLSPCVMYWPDNEPFPEPGQVRPNNLVGGVAPPILNTGNRGPISHQPGDWICGKCNYLNWRRRKVCQTCLPYAEGNGDSISAAVQAERISLLTSVLSQTNIGGSSPTSGAPSSGHLNAQQHPQPSNTTLGITATPRSHSHTPPQARRPFIDLTLTAPGPSAHPQPSSANAYSGSGSSLGVRSVHRSQSHFALGQQYNTASVAGAGSHTLGVPPYTASSPIYQTSGHRQPSPLYSTGPNALTSSNLNSNSNFSQQHSGLNTFSNNLGGSKLHTPAPAPLLPSFLQDMVQSPALSPTSTTTSSADLSSVEEYEDLLAAAPGYHPGAGQYGQYRDYDREQQQGHALFPRARGDSGSSVADPLGIALGAGAGAGVGGSGGIIGSAGVIGEGIGARAGQLPLPLGNIWRLDGEESKSLNAFPLPNHQELVGRKAGREGREGVRGAV